MRDLSCGDTRVYLEVEFRRVACGSCGLVKQEKLAWIADNPLYTQTICLLCRASMPGVYTERRRQGAALGLAYGQRFGEAVHARATATGGDAGAVGDWD